MEDLIQNYIILLREYFTYLFCGRDRIVTDIIIILLLVNIFLMIRKKKKNERTDKNVEQNSQVINREVIVQSENKVQTIQNNTLDSSDKSKELNNRIESFKEKESEIKQNKKKDEFIKERSNFWGMKKVFNMCMDLNLGFESDDGLSIPVNIVDENDNVLLRAFLLSKACENIDYKDEDKNTALMTAIMNENFEAVRLLLINGANIHLKNSDGKTPLALAKDNNNQTIIELLKEANKGELKKNSNDDEYLSGKTDPIEIQKGMVSAMNSIENTGVIDEFDLAPDFLEQAVKENDYTLAKALIEFCDDIDEYIEDLDITVYDKKMKQILFQEDDGSEYDE